MTVVGTILSCTFMSSIMFLPICTHVSSLNRGRLAMPCSRAPVSGLADIIEAFLCSCCLRVLPFLSVVWAVLISLAKAALKQARCSVIGVVVLIMSYPVWYWKASVSSTQLTVVWSFILVVALAVAVLVHLSPLIHLAMTNHMSYGTVWFWYLFCLLFSSVYLRVEVYLVRM